MARHEVRFYRDTTESNSYKAICTCGWTISGVALEYAQRRSATHDLEQIEEPPLKVEGFVSGLPD